MAVRAARASKAKEPQASWLTPQGALDAAAEARLAFVEAVRQGLPVELVDRLADAGYLTLIEVNRLVLPARTLAHRRQHHHPLSPEESDRFARVLRLIALAEATFGDHEKARIWLRRPNRALQGRVPLDLLDTDGGARAVETILGRIGDGVYS